MSRAMQRNPAVSIVVLLLAGALALYWFYRPADPESRPSNGEAAEKTGAQSYLFCFWNVENLFDDRADERTGPGDRDYDPWFANDPAIRKQKLERLCEALLNLNGGKGPDILAVCELEGERAAELLREALNARLTDATLHYSAPLVKELTAGRHICPAVLTRLPAVRDRTQLLGKRLRILETHLKAGDADLVVVVSHWTSRITDEKGEARDKYADQIYGQFKAMYQTNPQVDFVVCGDFNDAPADASVSKHLHAGGDRDAVRGYRGDWPLLYNLFADKDPKKFGTLYYRQWQIFDQIIVSPGMLDDRGWSCDPGSARTISTPSRPKDTLGRPWSFGGPKDKGARGYSDHFPVTVRLEVQGQARGGQ